MIFQHKRANMTGGVFAFGRKQIATVYKGLDKPIFGELWHGFSFHLSEIRFEQTETLTFSMGEIDLPEATEDSYTVRITEHGVAVVAKSEKDLIHGYMTLLDMIKINEDGTGLLLECCELSESPTIKNRMVHYCIFRDTELWEIERFVRFCGALKYSHIVLEFWGSLQYDCLPELCWSEKFTKADVAPIIKEANDMGLEIIPMFNHWGHATAGRVMHGKHVVLDQNPRLAYLFDETGWCWAIEKPAVRKLLRQIRRELCDLCGEGEYFHIGCDEAYGFNYSKESIGELCSFINEVSDELASGGRKTIMWADMLLFKKENYEGKYVAACPDEEREKMFLSLLKPDIIFADWQYWVAQTPIQSAVDLKSAGRNVIVAPWDVCPEYSTACIDTVKQHDMLGIMHTTWHTLSKGIYYVSETARACWSNDRGVVKTGGRIAAAEILRKVYFASGNYSRAGFSKKEIDDIT